MIEESRYGSLDFCAYAKIKAQMMPLHQNRYTLSLFELFHLLNLSQVADMYNRQALAQSGLGKKKKGNDGDGDFW